MKRLALAAAMVLAAAPSAAFADRRAIEQVVDTSSLKQGGEVFANGAQRLFVDPTFYDAGLGWDISSPVSGEIRTP